MYPEFFGLNEKPFSITPDPRYLYLSQRHADALAHLVYGLTEGGGFIQLTGEVGTGKTTLIRTLLQELPEDTDLALILNPPRTVNEFLLNICAELGIEPANSDTARTIIAALNSHLLDAHAAGRRVVLIVDEAQTLGAVLLEQVRLLTNLETPTQKLLQIILIGQPELRDLLQKPEMRQLAQRVTGRCHLAPLGKAEVGVYVDHRLRVAGCQRTLFDRAAIKEMYRRSRGIPRLINVIADRALLAAYGRDTPQITRTLVRQAASEVLDRQHHPIWPWATVATVVLAASLTGTATWWHGSRDARADPVTRSPSVVSNRTANFPVAAAPAPEIQRSGTTDSTALRKLLVAAGTNGEAQAFAELFALWGAHYDPARGNACTQALTQRLECLSSRNGSLRDLRTINRPAILTLRGTDGNEHAVVLTGLGYGDAEFLAGKHNFQLQLAVLANAWLGHQTILWRPPFTDRQVLKPGTRAEGVKWLRESLARLNGVPSNATSSLLYDSDLEAAVRKFQRAHQLRVDGIAGARTQLAILSGLGTAGAPTLRQ